MILYFFLRYYFPKMSSGVHSINIKVDVTTTTTFNLNSITKVMHTKLFSISNFGFQSLYSLRNNSYLQFTLFLCSYGAH